MHLGLNVSSSVIVGVWPMAVNSRNMIIIIIIAIIIIIIIIIYIYKSGEI